MNIVKDAYGWQSRYWVISMRDAEITTWLLRNVVADSDATDTRSAKGILSIKEDSD